MSSVNYQSQYQGGPATLTFRSLFQDLNPSRLVVYSSLLAFSVLFALKMDGLLRDWSWWSVFMPIWIWKCITVLGAVIGSYVWWRRPHHRLNVEEYVQYKAMLMSLATQLLLLMFELLAADNLESRRHLWILVFVPLIFVSVASIAVCVWSFRHDRSLELEMICSVNLLQFVFLALRLDHLIDWPWEITFVPLWIVLCVSLVGILYTVIFAGILLRLPDSVIDHRRAPTASALGYSFLVIPLLVFLVLITNKLDGAIQISYFTAFIPLYLVLFALLVSSFGSRGGNYYWFGMRKPPTIFLFSICPCLQLFGNISYSLSLNENNNNRSNSNNNESGNNGIDDVDGGNNRDEESSSMDNSGSSFVANGIPLELPNFNKAKTGVKGKWSLSKAKLTATEEDLTVVPPLAIEMPD